MVKRMRIKAKRNRNDVIVGINCTPSDQRKTAFLIKVIKFVQKEKYGGDGSLNNLSFFC